jgi:hypothetical protein
MRGVWWLAGWTGRARQTERDTRRARIRAAGLRSVKDDAVMKAAVDVRVTQQDRCGPGGPGRVAAKSLFWLRKSVRIGH